MPKQVRAGPRLLSKVSATDIRKALDQHTPGNWGTLSNDQRRENDVSFELGRRVLSAHTAENGTTFLIVTEPDRLETIVFLPEEYPDVFELDIDLDEE